jgi:hypothetical protein
MILELIIYHKNCLDGHLCVAIKQGISSLLCDSGGHKKASGYKLNKLKLHLKII